MLILPGCVDRERAKPLEDPSYIVLEGTHSNLQQILYTGAATDWKIDNFVIIAGDYSAAQTAAICKRIFPTLCDMGGDKVQLA